MSTIKIYAIDKQTGDREEISDLYWFEGHYVHSLTDDYAWTFEVEVDGVVHKAATP